MRPRLQRRSREHDPQNPLVWCDCYRDTVPLSLKLRGVTCATCRVEAGEAVDLSEPDALLLAEAATIEREIEEQQRERERIDRDISELEDERDAVDDVLRELGRRLHEIRAGLGIAYEAA